MLAFIQTFIQDKMKEIDLDHETFDEKNIWW